MCCVLAGMLLVLAAAGSSAPWRLRGECVALLHPRHLTHLSSPSLHLQRFLTENGLRLVLRSHEGPDAREGREDGMQPMTAGYTVDHDTPAGKLMTVFRCGRWLGWLWCENRGGRVSGKAAVRVAVV